MPYHWHNIIAELIVDGAIYHVPTQAPFRVNYMSNDSWSEASGVHIYCHNISHPVMPLSYDALIKAFLECVEIVMPSATKAPRLGVGGLWRLRATRTAPLRKTRTKSGRAPTSFTTGSKPV